MKIFVTILIICFVFEETIAKPRHGHNKKSKARVAANDRKTNSLRHLGNEIFGIPMEEAGMRVKDWKKGDKLNPHELGGYAQGDILFTGGLKNGWAWETFRWPQKTIPYIISEGFTDDDRAVIQSGIDDVNNYTCVRFVPHTNQRVYVRITTRFAGCYSAIGYFGRTYDINLQSGGCTSVKRTVLHELMHAIGFLHEHGRADRDDYVKINWENILEKDKHNFHRFPREYMNYYGLSYDYSSVLHYSRYAFTGNGGETIIPTDKSVIDMGEHDGFSKSDILKINRMYKCDHDQHAKNEISTKKRRRPTSIRKPKRTHPKPTISTPQWPVYRPRTLCWPGYPCPRQRMYQYSW